MNVADLGCAVSALITGDAAAGRRTFFRLVQNVREREQARFIHNLSQLVTATRPVLHAKKERTQLL
jgi:hypothetical protein